MLKQFTILLACCFVLGKSADAQPHKQKKLLPLDSTAKAMRGNMQLPFDNCLIKMSYGLQESNSLAFVNPGMTLIAKSKTIIKAGWDGIVSKVIPIDGMWVIIVKSGSVLHCYSNLAEPFVKINDLVNTGQSIGKIGLDDDGEYSIDVLVSNANGSCDPEKWFNWKTVCTTADQPIVYSTKSSSSPKSFVVK